MIPDFLEDTLDASQKPFSILWEHVEPEERIRFLAALGQRLQEARILLASCCTAGVPAAGAAGSKKIGK